MEEIIYTHLPMEYGNSMREEIKIIGSGKIDGYEYKIKNIRGSHPTAYIKLEENHPLYNKPYDDINIDVHGGLTDSGIQDDGYWIGWDYAHCGDYVDILNYYNVGARQWTTDEILEHCRDAVRQLKEYEGGYMTKIDGLDEEELKEVEQGIRQTAQVAIRTYEIFLEELEKSDLPQEVKDLILKNTATNK